MILGIANNSWSRLYFVEDNFCDWSWWGDSSSSIQFFAFGTCSRVQSKRCVECYYYTKYSCRTYLGCVHSNICLLINMPQLFHRLKNERKRELTGKKIREKKGK